MRKSVIILCICLVLPIVLFCTSCNYEERIKEENLQKVKNLAFHHLNSLFDSVIVDDASSSNDTYYAACNVSSSGKFFDISAQLKLEFKKSEKTFELVGEPIYEAKEVTFHSANKEFYYYGHRNCSELFQIKSMNKNTITVDIYGYELGSWGHDKTYKKTETWTLFYLKNSHCFEFFYYDVGKPYRIYPDHLEVGSDSIWTTGVQYTEFNKTFPRDPNNYWWFEELT